MQTITRHGGGSHYVRPDRVYRTGVLTSTMAYDPTSDVQDVAAAFTQYPIDMQVPMSAGVSGLRGFGANNIGLLQKLKLRYQAWKARRRGMMGPGWNYGAGMGGLGHPHMMGVAYPQMGQQIEPMQVNRAAMAQILMNGGVDAAAAAAQAGYSWDRWINARWNG